MTTYTYGPRPSDGDLAVILQGQTVTGAVIGDPVSIRGSNSWVKANFVYRPIGVYMGQGCVIIEGQAPIYNDLIPGAEYYLSDNGGIGNIGFVPIRIGVAIDTHTLLIDIDQPAQQPLGKNGYFLGSTTTTWQVSTTLTRLQFATDVVSGIAITNSQGSVQGAGFASYKAGYLAGGIESNVNNSSSIWKMPFTMNEAFNLINTKLSENGTGTGRVGASGFSSTVGGYIVADNFSTVVDYLDFATDLLTANIAAYPFPMGAGGLNPNSVGNGCSSPYAGYMICGNANPALSNVIKLNFANNAMSLTANTLSTPRGKSSSYASGSHAYFAGGVTNNFAQVTSTIDRLQFIDDSMSRINSTLAVACYSAGAISAPMAGFRAGGLNGGLQSVIDKMSFATETVALLESVLADNFGLITGFSDNGN